jgi:3-isopropylmalate/(R)-2-methylmalate dehydratase small subunit
MTPFKHITAVAAPLLRDNIDTDAIIPSREIKAVSRQGLAEGLFSAWRYLRTDSRELNPDFVLNQPAFANTRILLGGENFGCGSSREHAVWALHEYGIRVILARSFAPIFFGNSISNGLLPVSLPVTTLQHLAAGIQQDPQAHRLSIDLEAMTVTTAAGEAFKFEMDADVRATLLSGLDAIDLTLQSLADIEAFQASDRLMRPWVYLSAAVPSSNDSGSTP